MNFGLRYDYYAPYVQSDDRFADVYQNGFTIANIVTPQNSPYGRGLLQPNRKDVGPRFGFAYRPPLWGEWVVRGGYGIYYTPEISNAIFAMAEGAQATAGATVIGNPTGQPNIFFNNPFASAVSTPGSLPFAVSNDQNLKDSYIQQWNLNIQRKLPGNIVLDAGYVGSKGTRLIVTYPDLNIPLTIVDPRTAGTAFAQRAASRSAFPARSNRRQVSRQLHLSRAASEGGAAAVARPDVPYCLHLVEVHFRSVGYWRPSGGGRISVPRRIPTTPRRSRSVRLRRHPALRSNDPVRRSFLPGFPRPSEVSARRLAGLDHRYRAERLSPISSCRTCRRQAPGLLRGPIRLPTETCRRDKRTWKMWFNTAAFVNAPYGRYGTSPRTDAFRLPGVFNFDFSVNKSFHFGERSAFEFRAETFNLFNHYNPDPAGVDNNLNSATFGSIGLGVSGITTRVVQLGAKLRF